jgi:hypothetical protein
LLAKQKICGVYKITNIINGKIYVGSSKDVENRWCQHERALNEETHGNAHLQRAWNKYGGKKSFRFEVIEECAPVIQFEREQFYLNELNPFDENGYNIVRQISKQYMSDNYMIKKCEMCGSEYHTFSHLSKYCDECKEAIREYNKNWKIHWDPPVSERDARMWGYDSLDDFWESNI